MFPVLERSRLCDQWDCFMYQAFHATEVCRYSMEPTQSHFTPALPILTSGMLHSAQLGASSSKPTHSLNIHGLVLLPSLLQCFLYPCHES